MKRSTKTCVGSGTVVHVVSSEFRAALYSVCGIVGILARNAHLAPELLERATRSLAHRGPDDSGSIILHDTVPEPLEIGLGNTRLAILDLSALGHQPMQDKETGNWIVYNGEIYNFREVRQKLEREGVSFVSHSDTEVLLKAYGRWGERCPQELSGMFAFAIWDARHHKLFLARDPMGIKPLYYYSSAQYFLFASEVRTLISTGLVPRCLAYPGLLNYLTFGSIYDPNTLIEGVNMLRPGNYLVFEKGQTREVMYWDLADPKRSTEIPGRSGQLDRKNLEDELHGVLDESVRSQLVSDVTVGLFLSGGIDSSSLVAILSHRGVRLNTFSLVFREADYSEAEHSRKIAQQFRTEHQESTVSQRDALDSIPAAIRAMDQPTIDGVNTYFVSLQARAAGVKVALSGLGGDEMFAGYSSFRTVPRMERFGRLWQHVPGMFRRPLAASFGRLSPETDQNRKLAALVGDPESLIHPYFLYRMLFTPQQRNRLLAISTDHALEQANAPLLDSLNFSQRLDPVNRVSYLESRCYMLNTLLRDADFMSMAHGLEVRVPLIDQRLAERLFTIPGSWKLDGELPKPLLVGALQGALPTEVVRRPKRGFTLPFEHWLKDELRSGVEAVIRNVREGPLASVMDGNAARGVWTDFLRGRTSWSRPWAIYVLHRWCELHL
jgi:asparagine synthase (glutamine-hydrolysing)